MLILLIFAFISGIVTILSPCILPMLPIILAGSEGGKKNRAFGIVLGFVFSFTFFTLTLTTIVHASGISPVSLRFFAIALIMIFGLMLLVPPMQRWFTGMVTRVIPGGQKAEAQQEGFREKIGFKGLISGFPVGFSLGLVWTPCAGPIMASVISLALTESLDSGAILITFAYALGTALPMLLVMLTGRRILNRVPFLVRHTEQIQKIFGILMLLTGISLGLNWDRQFQTALLSVFPGYGAGITSLENLGIVQAALQEREEQTVRSPTTESSRESGVSTYETQPLDHGLKDYGPAPDIETGGAWLNTKEALSMADLHGKVVLIDFWTYSCINCIRTLPWLKSLYKQYKDDGLVIIGVHTPEFEFEKNIENVSQAVKDLGVDWPVVLDNDYKQWQAYNNRYWPAHYFIDVQSRIRYFHFGEGQYDVSERVIRLLLREGGKAPAGSIALSRESGNAAATPETYLGYSRQMGFKSVPPQTKNKVANYLPNSKLKNGEWALTGKWLIAGEYILPVADANLQFRFNAKKVFLVIEPENSIGKITVYLDGKKVGKTKDVEQGMLIPVASRLYELVDLPQPGSHLLRLTIEGRFKLFAFTFG